MEQRVQLDAEKKSNVYANYKRKEKHANGIERFSSECRKTKTKVITLANQKGRRQSSKPIKT